MKTWFIYQKASRFIVKKKSEPGDLTFPVVEKCYVDQAFREIKILQNRIAELEAKLRLGETCDD